jgi:hypothetical protein
MSRSRTAVTLNSRNAEALAGLVAAAASARKQPETLEWLKTIASREPSTLQSVSSLPTCTRLAGTGTPQSRPRPRRCGWPRRIRARPSSWPRSVADAEDADRLEPLAASLVARFPDRPDPRYYQATVLFLRGRAEEAIAPSAAWWIGTPITPGRRTC